MYTRSPALQLIPDDGIFIYGWRITDLINTHYVGARRQISWLDLYSIYHLPYTPAELHQSRPHRIAPPSSIAENPAAIFIAGRWCRWMRHCLGEHSLAYDKMTALWYRWDYQRCSPQVSAVRLIDSHAPPRLGGMLSWIGPAGWCQSLPPPVSLNLRLSCIGSATPSLKNVPDNGHPRDLPLVLIMVVSINNNNVLQATGWWMSFYPDQFPPA